MAIILTTFSLMKQMTPRLAVLDSNCWLDLLVFEDASVNRMRSTLEEGSMIALVCEATRQELIRVLDKPGISARCNAAEVISHFERLSRFRPLPSSKRHLITCADPDDQVFLDLAIEEGADFLFSKDRQLLRLKKQCKAQFQLLIISQSCLEPDWARLIDCRDAD